MLLQQQKKRRRERERGRQGEGDKERERERESKSEREIQGSRFCGAIYGVFYRKKQIVDTVYITF